MGEVTYQYIINDIFFLDLTGDMYKFISETISISICGSYNPGYNLRYLIFFNVWKILSIGEKNVKHLLA